ncbi:hypothetical protein ACNKHO_21685 [Shigella flexneri]
MSSNSCITTARSWQHCLSVSAGLNRGEPREDAGFWLFGKFTGATEAQTLKTWTMTETILGTVGRLLVWWPLRC